MTEGNFVDADLKKKADEGIAGIKKDLFVDSVIKFAPLVIILLLGFLLGTTMSSHFNSDKVLDNMSSMVYAGSECSLRSNSSVVWIPDMVVQYNNDGNITGIPVCVPVDRNSGLRVKK